MLDYEFTNQIELATQEELEKLEAFNYEYLPEKIELANKILSPKGYGLFSYLIRAIFHIIHCENRGYNKVSARRSAV